MLPVDKLNSRIFYDVLIVKLSSPPTSQKYFERQFGHNLKWVDIYRLPHLVTSDSRTRFFQFKLSHNILFLKSRLFHLNHVPNPLCSLCNNFNETPSHFFCECLVVVGLWNEVRAFFSPSIIFEPLTPKSALLGISNKDDLYLIKNHILLIFKFCIYKNREKTLNIHTILNAIKDTYKKEISISNKTEEKLTKKWSKVSHLFL